MERATVSDERQLLLQFYQNRLLTTVSPSSKHIRYVSPVCLKLHNTHTEEVYGFPDIFLFPLLSPLIPA
jgi:hypothetical protein